jgi:hypothetical protein
VHRPAIRPSRRLWWALAATPLLAAACGSGSGSGSGSSQSADTRLQSADAAVQSSMSRYTSAITRCKTASTPVVCLEAADRTLGGQIHDYANVLAVGRGFGAPAPDLTAARNAAQTLANSLEILGDAEPTQSNYDQVLNTFNVSSAITQLQGAVHKVNSALG